MLSNTIGHVNIRCNLLLADVQNETVSEKCAFLRFPKIEASKPGKYNKKITQKREESKKKPPRN